jgi:hypothetical protein
MIIVTANLGVSTVICYTKEKIDKKKERERRREEKEGWKDGMME